MIHRQMLGARIFFELIPVPRDSQGSDCARPNGKTNKVILCWEHIKCGKGSVKFVDIEFCSDFKFHCVRIRDLFITQNQEKIATHYRIKEQGCR